MKPYLLFDAGGTLIYPNADVICAVCGDYGYDITVDTFLNGLYGAMHQLDTALRHEQDTSWIHSLVAVALKQVGVTDHPADQITDIARKRCGADRFWTYTRPWVPAALDRLCDAGYRMSVISNSDGTVEAQLREVGLAKYFERIDDSGIVGIEKPDPRLFQHSLTQLGLSAQECIYIGDLVYVDVLGANRAGMAVVHIDPYGRYQGWPGYHVTSVADYADRLISGVLTLEESLLYPFIDQESAEAGA